MTLQTGKGKLKFNSLLLRGYIPWIIAGSFRVSLVIDQGRGGGGSIGFEILFLGTFVTSRPTLSCSHWWEFVQTECCHDAILRATSYVIFSWLKPHTSCKEDSTILSWFWSNFTVKLCKHGALVNRMISLSRTERPGRSMRDLRLCYWTGTFSKNVTWANT